MKVELTSVSAQRFLHLFTYNLNDAYAMNKKQKDRIIARLQRSEGHPTISRHNIGNVDFYLLWHAPEKWSIKADQWTIRSNMMGFEISGDENACNRDLTVLMMVGLDDL
jgi:hypothetical protein